MPTGSPAEYAAATGKDRGNVYRAIRKGKFRYPDAELTWEEQPRPIIKWKTPKTPRVKAE